jgi:hypothetical protein
MLRGADTAEPGNDLSQSIEKNDEEEKRAEYAEFETDRAAGLSRSCFSENGRSSSGRR